MNQLESGKVIESLREGIPPEGKVSLLTVGRDDEINKLKQILHDDGPQALLVKANYGCGKTHLLKFIKEEALRKGYVTSLITLDSKSNARFNRMDQIFGQICRNIQVPGNNQKSVRYLFDKLFEPNNQKQESSKKATELINKISNLSKWDYSHFLHSEAMFIAVRAWRFSCRNDHTDSSHVNDIIEDWLFNPYNYYARRSELYDSLIESFRGRGFFRDPRPRWKFYDAKEGIFNFQINSYAQSWGALCDLDTLAKAGGYKGFLILFDEFEDVIYNLERIDYKQDAFWNLFQFFSKERFPSLSFFAVTPDFVVKCKRVLQEKNIYDYDYSRFDKLGTFEMTSLTTDQLIELSGKMMHIHEVAYTWKIDDNCRKRIQEICINSLRIPIGDRVRQTVKDIVKALDDALEY